MFDDFDITLQEIQADIEMTDYYQQDRKLCPACGGVTYMSTTAECFDCGESGVN